MTIKLEQLLFVLGGTLLSVGLVLGFMPVKANGVGCGTALTGQSDDARLADFRDTLVGGANQYGSYALDGRESSCEDSISSRRTVSLGLGLPGLTLVLVGVGIRNRARLAEQAAN